MESCVVCLLEKQRYLQNPIQNFLAPRGATLRTTLLRAFHPPHLGEWRPLAVEGRSVSWEDFTHLENRREFVRVIFREFLVAYISFVSFFAGRTRGQSF